MANLTEEEIDDILYCSRANELEELKPYLSSLSAKYNLESIGPIITTAIDTETGNNALHYASANGHLEMIQFILSQFTSSEHSLKPSLNMQNKSGNTPLHWAALNGHLAIVKLLLESGADVSVLNGAGHDAVYEAEINDKSEVVEWLLKEGVGIDTGIGGAEGEEEMAGVEENGVANGSTIGEASSSGDALKEGLEKIGLKEEEQSMDTNGG